MKFKSILIATLTFLISCETSNIDDVYSSPDDVSFLISQDNNGTKGAPIDNVEMLTNIGVFATLTEGPYANASTPVPNFMLNQLVEHDGDKWGYDSSQRWSTDPNKLTSFFAYAPFAANENGITIVEESGKMPTIHFQVPQTNTMQPDLMVATPVYDRVKSQGDVELTLRHALAAISFSVKGDVTRKITAVKLNNIFSTATLALDSPDITWSYPYDRSDLSYELGIKNGDNAPAYGGVATSITASNGYLMMIPQDITDVEIEVSVENETELIYLDFEPGSKWVAGEKYNYIIDLETETLSYDISETSNCYIVKNAEIREVYIPIDQRINTFWRKYSGIGDKKIEMYMINSNTEWDAKIEWCDNDNLNIEGVTTVEHYKGFIPADCPTSKSFVCNGTKAVMKVTLPANKAIGNILISVSKDIEGEKKILWSWHLWVTDYNPDSPIHTPTKVKRYKVEQGEIHRYTKDSDYWTTGLYNQTFAMDRDLGSHDYHSKNGLFYQWGRKDPFSTIIGWSTEKEFATFDTAVQNPKTFYAKKDGWCSEPSDDYSANNYLWYDINIQNNDENIFKKSLFDPSPLGWVVPVSAAYEEWKWRSDYGKYVYFELSGHIYYNNGCLERVDDITSLWFSDRSSDCNNDEAHYHYVNDNNIYVDDVPTSFGHRIRPVKICN